jgi:feruloyl esterase
MSKSRFFHAFVGVSVVVASFIFVPLPLAAASCEELAAVKLPATSIVTVQSVAAGEFVPSSAGVRGAVGQFRDLPAFCRVAAVLRPSGDSEIKIEVWLPAATGWNGKFQGVGNGGWSGAINPGPLAAAVRRGYATAMTDTGHEGGSGSFGSFALGHPEKLIDFGFRAVHEMTVTAKAIIAEYYGNGPRLSYWNGCSSGGKQGLKEAQRFPADYDGIIAGATANFWTHLMTGSIWIAQAVHRDEQLYSSGQISGNP